jgi:hypothetical protein
MARTWLITAACSGARRAAYLNREWMAASRAFRVALPFPRWSSRCCRNAPISAASRSARLRLLGAFPVRSRAKDRRSLHVSR